MSTVCIVWICRLVDKGVKVDLGIPYDLWDSPSVEVTQMKVNCESMLEQYEDDLETWFNTERKKRDHHSGEAVPLIQFLCEDRVLSKDERACLYENTTPKQNIKGDRGEL